MAARREFEGATQSSRESYGELIGELASQSAGLVRDEIALVKQEVTNKVDLYRSPISMLALGGVVALVASLCWCATLIIFLSKWIELWLSALLVSTVVAVVAASIIIAAVSRLKHLRL
jgi:hypothetical protein